MHEARLDYSGDVKARRERHRSLFSCAREAWMASCLTFVVTLVLYSFTELYHVYADVTFTVVVLLGAIYIGRKHKPGSVKMPLALGMKLGLFCGVILGLVCYSYYGYPLIIYQNSRSYHNAVPSMPSRSVSDGGRLYWAAEAHLGLESSTSVIGEDGHVYCAAPIRDLSPSRRVEYWAVGRDCCGEDGFHCDSALDPAARGVGAGGAVLFDNRGIFSWPTLYHYDDVRRKAEATYTLDSSLKPIYVRWLRKDQLEGLVDDYRFKIWSFVTFTTIGYAFLSSYVVFAMTKAIHPKPAPFETQLPVAEAL